ncbi:hypothetical protein Nepgr_007603 [Nepenthes gracilis]|uniref:Uncharacterized protein n=1 Tax=Nepenthes gracilis TaxID=150966 RepID=A0AAD3S768_NEPGR|nr:hypothetical protein Nepgr_007603 [Nepenthes gracilis]
MGRDFEYRSLCLSNNLPIPHGFSTVLSNASLVPRGRNSPYQFSQFFLQLFSFFLCDNGPRCLGLNHIKFDKGSGQAGYFFCRNLIISLT